MPTIIRYLKLGTKKKRLHRVRLTDDIAEIEVGKFWVKVDYKDLVKIQPYRMHVSHNKYRLYYPRLRINGKVEQLGNFLLGEKAEYADADPLNCTRINLIPREGRVRKRANLGNSSGYLGVNWDTQEQAWAAHITVNREPHHLGFYKTIEAAKKARLRAEKTYLGRIVSVDYKDLLDDKLF